jgi:hypothetical protein
MGIVNLLAAYAVIVVAVVVGAVGFTLYRKWGQ